MAFNKNKVVETARKYVEKGQVDKAIKEYLKVVREDPKDVRVWLKIGDLYAKKGARLDAIDTYLKVARFYNEQGFDLKAVAVYKQILKLDPRLIEVNLKLAELYRTMGLMKEAMEQFETVASHFHREGKTKEALATVRQLVELDPENVATRIKLAELYSKEGMVSEAVTEFTKACEYLRANNRQDDFVKVAERLLWHQPENLELSRELASLYLQRNDPRRALFKLQGCFKANSRDVETLALLAQAFQALEQKSKTIQVLKELARVLEEDGNRTRASEIHRKILQLAPGDPDSAAYLESGDGQSGGQSGASRPSGSGPSRPSQVQQLAMASQEVSQPRKHNPTGSMPLVDPRAIPGLGFGAQADGSPSRSAPPPTAPHIPQTLQTPQTEELDADLLVDDDFTTELTDDGDYDSSVEGEMYSEEIAKILTDADVYVRYGLHQKAIEHLRRIFDLDPDNVEAHEQLKEILLNQGREREAIAELMRLAELTAGREPDRAEVYLREVLSFDGTHAGALELASRFHLSLTGDHEIEIIDSSDVGGGVAPIEEVLDLDAVDVGGGLGHKSRAPSVGDPSYEFVLDGDDGEYQPPGAEDHLAVTMELSMDEVESVLDFVEGGNRPENYEAPALQTPAPVAAYNYEEGADFPDPPVFDPEDARRFDAEPGWDPSRRGSGAAGVEPSVDEPVFDPLDAAAFDADFKAAAREFGEAPQTDSEGPTAFDEPVYGTADYRDSPIAATVQMSSDELDGLDLGGQGFIPAATQLAEPPYYAGGPAVGHPGGAGDSRTQEMSIETVDTGFDLIEERIIETPPPTLEQTATGLEDELDEADFYISQRLYDDARTIIGNLLRSYPEHPLLLAKQRELEELQAAASAAQRETYVPASQLDKEALAQLEPDMSGSGLYQDKQPAVLLGNHVDDEDAETHYDLGLAYKEMGLYEDAIKAFKKVLVVPGREVQCRLMIGLCQREQGNFAEAIHQFKAGLHAPEISDREQLSLYYEIATSYERVNDPKEASYFYELIRKRNPGYRDVEDRLAAMRDGRARGGDRHGARAAADDADAAIDSLLAESDPPHPRR